MTSAAGIPLLGVIDDSPSHRNLRRLRAQGITYLGTSASVCVNLPPRTNYLVGIANGAVRQRLASAAERHNLCAFTYCHPSATIGIDCELGPGAVVWPGARLTTNIFVGRHVHINQNATIGHDTVLEEFSTINPLAAISGDCTIGSRSMIGTNSAVLQGLTVGKDATVGASACVTKNVEANVVVKGVPAQ